MYALYGRSWHLHFTTSHIPSDDSPVKSEQDAIPRLTHYIGITGVAFVEVIGIRKLPRVVIMMILLGRCVIQSVRNIRRHISRKCQYEVVIVGRYSTGRNPLLRFLSLIGGEQRGFRGLL